MRLSFGLAFGFSDDSCAGISFGLASAMRIDSASAPGFFASGSYHYLSSDEEQPLSGSGLCFYYGLIRHHDLLCATGTDFNLSAEDSTGAASAWN